MTQVLVVDYGAGNTRSVRAAFARLGVGCRVTGDAEAIAQGELVVLPGVGAARSAMAHLTANGVATAIRDRFARGAFTLGICLGLQLALESSDEDGGVTGLGLVEGTARRLTAGRVPRLGWATVEPWSESYYFAHCFAAESPRSVATSEGVCAAVRDASFLGVQFHPEKSGAAGLAFLDQCLSRA